MSRLPCFRRIAALFRTVSYSFTAGVMLSTWFMLAPGALRAQDYALRFGNPTSATTYVLIPFAPTLAFRQVAGYTVEAFIRLDKMPDGNEDMTVANIFGCASRMDLYLRGDGMLTCRLNLANDRWFEHRSPSLTWNLNEWYHVAASWDVSGNILRLFRNGQMISSVATSTNSFGDDILINTDARSIGGLRYPWRHQVERACQFYGTIDEVRVSTIARYTNDFQMPRNPFERDQYTVALWHFNEGTGTTVADASMHGHTGTVYGQYSWVPGYFVGLDTTPPAAVTLTAQPQTSSVLLTWTAPGDDGADGTLEGRYYIQYATFPAVVWSTASAQITITTTATPGTPQARTVTGLTGGVTYYFSLWSADEVPNLSARSNTASTWAGNAPPVCTITAPSNGQGFPAPANITITATATDPDGTVVRVEFFAGSTSLGVDTASPWSYTWNNVSSGTYALTAQAMDAYGGVGTSAVVNINVNQAPVVALMSPADGLVVDAPAVIELAATATDPDGSIVRVEFWRGTTLLNADTTSPYAYSWTNVAAGTYALRAIAYDNGNVTSTSSVANVTVNAKPVVSITTPTAGAVFLAGGDVAISATASDSDGSVVAVSFYAGTTQLGGAVSASPYAYTWTGVAAGTYALTARAVDNRGSVSTSAVVAIAVTAAPVVSITTPTAGAKFAANSDITMHATASDSDGTVAVVRFYAGTTLLGAVSASPYTYTWTGVAPGAYTLRAEAQDDLGMTAQSGTVAINVNQSPTISITGPTNGATFSAPATISITVDATDPDGSVVSVVFFQNGNLLGTITESPFSYTWTGVGEGTYQLVAVAVDDFGDQDTADPVTVSVITGPSCTIVAPADGTQVEPGSDLLIEADAQDSYGTITQVEFFINGTSMGTTPIAPYQYVWTLIPPGQYTIRAQARNDQGLTSPFSSPVRVVANRPPVVSLTSPADGASIPVGTPVVVAATASDPDGNIVVVRFYADGVQIGSATTAPYQMTWVDLAAGSYRLFATAEDDLGAVSTTTAVNITVTSPNQAPVVSITSPADGTTFTTPTTVNIPLAATASDPDGTVASVRFYTGGTLIATVTAAPYSTTWANVGHGVYPLRAVATDNQGASSTSTAVTVTVTSGTTPNQAPVVSITSPADGATFTAAPVASIAIAATASDPEGQLQRVEFYANGTFLASDPTAPYSHTWVNVGPGTYVLTAVAYDVPGLASTSTAVTVTVVQSTALYTIEGYVTGSNGQGIAGVVVTLTGASSGTVVTGTDGRYSFGNLASGNYTVRPAKDGWTFVPAVLTYTPLNRSWQNQNFVGEPAIASNKLKITGGVDGYVNPEYRETVRIWVNPKSGGTLNVTVYDLRGRVVWKKGFTVVANDPQELECDLANGGQAEIPTGVYLIQLKGAGYDTVKRIAVVR